MGSSGTLTIRNVHLPHNPSDVGDKDTVFDVHCEHGLIQSIEESRSTTPQSQGKLTTLLRLVESWSGLHRSSNRTGVDEIDAEAKGILLPSLCHSHIHLDKCFLLDRCGNLKTGSFNEALSVTSQAKAHFAEDLLDLYERGERLVKESAFAGVTSMRAFVEVDKTVNEQCLNVGRRLKKDYEELCEIQLTVFAQDPLYDDPSAAEPGFNYDILGRTSSYPEISVVGSAPYVEPTLHQAKANIKLILDLAKQYNLHADFHLDYNLDASTQPLVYDVIDCMKKIGWNEGGPARRVTIGHGTRYSLFSEEEWLDLKQRIGDLPISFVALPQSDLYMMGKTELNSARLAPRGTIPVPFATSRMGMDVAMSVNNVGNAFTPQGSVDPLGLCPLGVATYQDASEDTCQTLVSAVSETSKYCTGLRAATPSKFYEPGSPADFVLLHSNTSLRSVALNPCYARTTIRAGKIITSRKVSELLLTPPNVESRRARRAWAKVGTAVVSSLVYCAAFKGLFGTRRWGLEVGTNAERGVYVGIALYHLYWGLRTPS